jgi:hypothetical protein
MRLALIAMSTVLALSGAAPARAQAIDFGDDSGEFARDGQCDDRRFRGATISDFARDGQCDDIRFEGIGAAELLIPVNTFRDASDCQRLCRFGVVALRDYR